MNDEYASPVGRLVLNHSIRAHPLPLYFKIFSPVRPFRLCPLTPVTGQGGIPTGTDR